MHAHHLGSFDVTDSQDDFADGMAPSQLHNLSGGGELGIHFHH